MWEQDQSDNGARAYAEYLDIQTTLQAEQGLTLLRDVLLGRPAQAFLDLLRGLAVLRPEAETVALTWKQN